MLTDSSRWSEQSREQKRESKIDFFKACVLYEGVILKVNTVQLQNRKSQDVVTWQGNTEETERLKEQF